MTMIVNRTLAGSMPTGVPRVLGQSAVPVMLAPSATWDNATGAFTFSTPLPVFITAAWVRFVALGLNGSTGGPSTTMLYWCVFSSTTSGQAYNLQGDPYTPFMPYVPASLPGFLPTTAGTHVQSAFEISVCNITVPAGAMGPNGSLRVRAVITSSDGSTASRTMKTRLSTQLVKSFGINSATKQCSVMGFAVANRGSQSQQLCEDAYGSGYAGSVPYYYNINTAVDQALIASISVATPTDIVILEHFVVEVMPG